MPSDNFSVASNRTIFLTDIFLTVVNFSLVPNHVSPPKKEKEMYINISVAFSARSKDKKMEK